MGAEWMPEADRDYRNWACYGMSKNTTSRRVVTHWSGSPKTFSPKSQADYMWKGNGNTGYHLLVPMSYNYRPLQLRPASCGAGSLLNNGSLSTSPNKQGTISIQICVICTIGDDPFVKGPGPWWPAVLDWCKGWDIPEKYVDVNWSANKLMTRSVWYSNSSGWTAHKQVPETNVVRKPDPGPVVDKILWGRTSSPTPPPPSSPDSFVKFTAGGGTVSARLLKITSPMMKGRDVRQAQACLSEWDCSPGKHDSVYGNNTVGAVKTFQKARGLVADGIVGSKTWSKLIGG